MIQALVWKEYREQRTVWLALAFLGAGMPMSLTVVFAPQGWVGHEDLRMGLGLTAVILAWTQGLVSGAMLLAGEREERTAVFLEGLPGSRRRVWVGKCLAGLLLVGAQVALLVATGIGVRYFGGTPEFVLGVLLLSIAALTGFGWGLFFSAYTSSALTAILCAFGAQALFAPPAGMLAAEATFRLAPLFPGKTEAALAGSLTMLLLMSVGALLLSSHAFTAEDRRRLAYRRRVANAPEAVVPSAPLRTFWAPWGRAFWLAGRQMKWFVPGLLAFALLLGFGVLLLPPLAWLMVSLLLGVLCGVTAFADEQEQGTFRFLGEQRLSLVPLWVVKVGLRYLLCCLAMFIALLPLVFTLIPFSGPPPAWMPTHMAPGDLFLFLLIWPAYGFAIAILCGLLFRRTLIAGVVALGISALLAVVWIPSLVNGGVHLWQVFGVPGLALGASFLLARFWVAGRLTSGPGVGLIAATGVGCLLWTVGGIWYRVAEVPDAPEDPDLAGFVASLPTPEENEAGSLIRSAGSSLRTLRHRGQEAAPVGMAPGQPRPATFEERIDQVLDHGWPAGDAKLAARLDEVFADDWDEKLTRAADLPLGVVEDPRHLTVASPLSVLQDCRWAAQLLAARGLQRQTEGKPEVFVEHLRVGLALSRHLRHRGPLLYTLYGQGMQNILVRGLDRWLEGLHGRPDLLRKSLAILVRHEQAIPDRKESAVAEYLIVLNSLEQPHAWMGNEAGPDKMWEVDLIATCWQVPWEAERNHRLLRAARAGEMRTPLVARLFRTPIGALTGAAGMSRQDRGDRISRTFLHAAQLKVALRLYEAEQGRPAERLGQLLEKNYLFSIPSDPFRGGPFHYRLSRGEKIVWPPEEQDMTGEVPPGGPVVNPGPPLLSVPAGQGILWSTGPDLNDDGAREQGLSRQIPMGTDWVFLVPRPPG
jgi:hypothetical protein